MEGEEFWEVYLCGGAVAVEDVVLWVDFDGLGEEVDRFFETTC